MREGAFVQSGEWKSARDTRGEPCAWTPIQGLRYWVGAISVSFSGRGELWSNVASDTASGGLKDRDMRVQDDDSVTRILLLIIELIVEHPHSVEICSAIRNGRTSFTVLADARDKERLAAMETSIRRLLIAIGSRRHYKYDVLIVTPGHAKDTTTKKLPTSEAYVTHGPEE